MSSQESIILYFSLKNGVRGSNYQLKIIVEDKTSGKNQEYEIDNIKWAESQKEIYFKKSIELNFIFDKKQKFKILAINYDQNQRIKTEEIKTVLSSIICHHNSIYEKPLNRKFPDKEILCIKVIKNNKYNNKVSIFDFLKAGMRLSSFIAIDFSNGKNKKSLSESDINYSKIMKQILHKMLAYNKNNQFFIFGYGAKLRNSNNFEILYRSVFNLNMKDKNSAICYEKVIEEYKKCLSNIISDEKIYLSSVIRKITKEIYNSYDLRYYNVLFILSRELTAEEDNQEIIDVFIESGYLPLSIIIICEGQNNFYKMNKFYGSQIKKSSNKMNKIRNNIKCITFSDYDENEERMIESCLREINLHIIEYFRLNNCTPAEIEKKNQNQNIVNSIEQYKKSIWIYESRLSLIKKEEEKVESKLNNVPNFNKIYNDSKRMPKEQEKKQIIIKETPKEPENYLLPEITLINPKMKNPYDKNKNSKERSNKETPKGFELPKSDSIITNLQNPYGNKGNLQNNNINNNNYIYITNQNYNNKSRQGENININPNPIEKQFKITPGNSINPKIELNPYKKEVEPRQFQITPEGSINPTMNYNPYSINRETPRGKNNYFIPKQSISQGNIINPYYKDSKNYNNYNEKQKNNVDSRLNENISTNNSNNDENIKHSKMIRITNYDVDKV